MQFTKLSKPEVITKKFKFPRPEPLQEVPVSQTNIIMESVTLSSPAPFSSRKRQLSTPLVLGPLGPNLLSKRSQGNPTRRRLREGRAELRVQKVTT